MKNTFLLFTLIFPLFLFAEDNPCNLSRAEKILENMNFSKEDFSISSYEYDCEESFFCFSGSLTKSKVLKNNELPSATQISICAAADNKPDIASVLAPKGSTFVVDKSISCNGLVVFNSATQSFCTCAISKPFKYQGYDFPAETTIMMTPEKKLGQFRIYTCTQQVLTFQTTCIKSQLEGPT